MNNSLNKPKLLAPAGNLSKLKVALTYGADAVYVGGPQYGLRQGADNFTFEELRVAVEWAHERGKKVYVALNAMPHVQEMERLVAFLKELELCNPDAVIISDAGVFSLVKTHTKIPCHISTQASVCNSKTAEMWLKAGAKRIVLARELIMHEVSEICNAVPIEIETFVHGSMCASYSGKCTISNYTAGRDANRGGCVQNCRYQYHIYDEKSGQKDYDAYIMNARDLMVIKLMPQLIEAGIHTFKIEGRMKSNLYVAQSVRMYRKALNTCFEEMQTQEDYIWDASPYERELQKISNRSFGTGSFEKRAFAASVNYGQGGYKKGLQYVGVVVTVDSKRGALVDVRFPFSCGDTLQLLCLDASTDTFVCDSLLNVNGDFLLKTKANSLVYIPCLTNVKTDMVLVTSSEPLIKQKAS